MSSPVDNDSQNDSESNVGDVTPATAKWRFLVDENLPRLLAERLRTETYVVEHVVEIGLRGHTDADVYAYAQ
jgi:hypothetical protein